MTTILCLTRGGEASYPNQDGAIRIAKERDADLVFLHVSNARFLNKMASPILVDVETELEHLSEFILEMAKERAKEAGLQAHSLAKSGPFQQALWSAIDEVGADVVILGSPAEDTGHLNRTYLEDLIQKLSAERGVEVILLSQGRIKSHDQPAQGETSGG